MNAKPHPVYTKARASMVESGTAWIEPKDTGALVRSALQTAFPGVKFGVRTQTYSGGSSVHVSWTDGPSQNQVESIAEAYSMGDFDGMIDLAHSCDLWLAPDGSVSLAHDGGTVGSMGIHPELNGDAHHVRAIIIKGGAKFVFCHREFSGEGEKIERVGRLLCEKQRIEYQGRDTQKLFGDFDRDYLVYHAMRVLSRADLRGGEIVDVEHCDDMPTPFRVVLA